MPITSFRRRRGGKGDKRGRHRRPNKYSRRAKAFGRRARRRRSSYSQSKQISKLASQIGMGFSPHVPSMHRKRKRPPAEPLSQESRASRVARVAGATAATAAAVGVGQALTNIAASTVGTARAAAGPQLALNAFESFVTTGSFGGGLNPFQMAAAPLVGLGARAFPYIRRLRRAMSLARGAGHGNSILPI